MLTTEQIRDFDRQGYLVFRPGLPDALLDGAVRSLHGKFNGNHQDAHGVVYHPNRIQDAWLTHADVHRIAAFPSILAALQALFSRRPLPFQTLNFEYGSEQRTHSDTIHFNSAPAGFMCGVWVALEDVGPEQGPLLYFPGSHRLPEVTLDDLGSEVRALQLRRAWDARPYRSLRRLLAGRNRRSMPGTRSVYEDIYVPHYEPHIENLTRTQSLAPAYGTIRKGDALIWAANLLHGGSPHRDRSRTRLSQVTHYFFEGCRYYTPLMQTRSPLSGRRLEHWRSPRWIPEAP